MGFGKLYISLGIMSSWYPERMLELADLLLAIRRLHDRIRTRVVEATAEHSSAELSQVVAHEGGDMVFALDRVSEAELLEFVAAELVSREPIVLVAEGLPGGRRVLPAGANSADCRWRIIVDPIDGTRCLMYQKRSGWVLTGVAPNRGEETNLQDICLAVQTEIPLLKQHLCDQLWAVRGQGAEAVRHDRLTGESRPLKVRPTQVESIQFGYAAISRFFPGMRDVLAAIEDEVIREALGPQPSGGTLTFEDQYPSTGGQLYSLLSGADRFLADLRPLMRPIAAERGEALGHCCHPYDICTMLIAEELGVRLADPTGAPLNVPLDVETDVAWVGYANDAIRRQVEPVLLAALKTRNLIE
jgi:fructose-1,6-bisphosphatase/inositol monophosphatase family enzyme